MKVIGVILMTMLTHSAYKGSKVLIALYALEFGAKPWMIGLLFTGAYILKGIMLVLHGPLNEKWGHGEHRLTEISSRELVGSGSIFCRSR